MRDNRVAAAPLGGIEPAVRRLDEIGCGLAYARHQGFDADADGDVAAGRFGVRDEQLFDRLARLLGERGDARRSRPGSSSANSSPP